MGCCRGQVLARLDDVRRRLEARGLGKEARETATMVQRLGSAYERAHRIESRLPERERQAVDEHIEGAPDKVNKLYEECKKNPPATAQGRVKEYCAKVAWDIYNTSIKK